MQALYKSFFLVKFSASNYCQSTEFLAVERNGESCDYSRRDEAAFLPAPNNKTTVLVYRLNNLKRK